MNTIVLSSDREASLVRITHIVYALHALGLALGAFGAASVLGSFLFGWPSIIAVILNYVKRGEARGTWLESHFSWQIRTFWYAAMWVVVAYLMFITIIGIPFFFVIVALAGLWVMYRVVRGWLALNDRRAMPMD